MKRTLWLLLSALFLYGCGGGGGTTGSPSSTTPAATQGNFTLNIVDASTPVAKSIVPSIRVITPGTTYPATGNSVRVIIKQNVLVPTTVWDYDGNGDPIPGSDHTVDIPTVIYKDIRDFPSATSVNMPIPIGNNYTAEVIVYNVNGSNNSILKYGKNSDLTGYFNVTAAGGSTTVVVNTVQNILNMDINNGLNDPTNLTVNSTGSYNVTHANGLPFKTAYKIQQDFAATSSALALATFTSIDTNVVKSTSASSVSFVAPATSVAGAVYVQGLFTIDPSFLKTGESAANWTRIYPNPTYGEFVYANLNQLVNVPVPGQ